MINKFWHKTVTIMLLLPTLMILSVSMTSVAWGAGYEDSAAHGLEDNQTYVDPGVQGDFNETALSNAIQSPEIGVIVLPQDALVSAGGVTPYDIAKSIQQQAGYDNLIAYFEGEANPYIVVGVNAQTIGETITQNRAGSTNPEMVLIETLQQTTITPPVNNDINEGFNFLPTILIMVPILIVAGVMIVRERLKTKPTKRLTTTAGTVKILPTTPQTIQNLTEKLNNIIKDHQSLGEHSLAVPLNHVVMNLQELFVRLNKKGTDSQKRLAEIEYVDKLTKLVDAVGKDNYFDFVTRGTYWDNPEEKIVNVKNAVNAVNNQIITNIKQINSSKDLEFQVVLESLLSSTKTTKLDDIYTTRNPTTTTQTEKEKTKE